jgi:hypothetical protein
VVNHQIPGDPKQPCWRRAVVNRRVSAGAKEDFLCQVARRFSASDSTAEIPEDALVMPGEQPFAVSHTVYWLVTSGEPETLKATCRV